MSGMSMENTKRTLNSYLLLLYKIFTWLIFESFILTLSRLYEIIIKGKENNYYLF